MFDFLKGPVLAIQDFYILTGAALRNEIPNLWNEIDGHSMAV